MAIHRDEIQKFAVRAVDLRASLRDLQADFTELEVKASYIPPAYGQQREAMRHLDLAKAHVEDAQARLTKAIACARDKEGE